MAQECLGISLLELHRHPLRYGEEGEHSHETECQGSGPSHTDPFFGFGTTIYGSLYSYRALDLLGNGLPSDSLVRDAPALASGVGVSGRRRWPSGWAAIIASVTRRMALLGSCRPISRDLATVP